MATPWDDSFKILLSENPQDFVTLVMPEAQFQRKLLTEFAGRKATADGLLEIRVKDKPALLHIEVQSTNDPEMAECVLNYALRAKHEHQRDVYSCVIYLREQGEVPSSPLQWPKVNGRAVLTFHYVVLEVYKMQPEDVRQWGLPGLLPLLLLTQGGATREIAEEKASPVHLSCLRKRFLCHHCPTAGKTRWARLVLLPYEKTTPVSQIR